MEAFIRGIPKAELHIHIEGSLEPELMFRIAQRNGIKLRFDTVDALRAAYQFTDLQSFLDIYYEGAGVLLEERDFYDMTWAYLERAAADNVRHAEIFFDPQTHTSRGVPFSKVINGIHQALEHARARLNVSSHLILCFLRHLSAEAAMETLAEAMAYRDWIPAVGLDSSEVGHPPRKFAGVFEKALGEGFLTVAHAGEEGPPEYIREALELLKVSRIDHGVRCIEDSRLVARLREDQVPLTVCPLSNVKLRVFQDMEHHNLKQLMDLGLCVTVNSDDPSYFGGYICANYLAAQQSLKLDLDYIVRLARNSFQAAFLDAARKGELLAEVDKYTAAAG